MKTIFEKAKGVLRNVTMTAIFAAVVSALVFSACDKKDDDGSGLTSAANQKISSFGSSVDGTKLVAYKDYTAGEGAYTFSYVTYYVVYFADGVATSADIYIFYPDTQYSRYAFEEAFDSGEYIPSASSESGLYVGDTGSDVFNGLTYEAVKAAVQQLGFTIK